MAGAIGVGKGLPERTMDECGAPKSAAPEMVQRVAKAVYAMMVAKDPNPTRGETWDSIYPDVQEGLRDIARAAIAAMREPTEAMMEAMQDSGVFAEVNGIISFCAARGSHPGGLKKAPMPAAYTIMIDAALGPQAEGESSREDQ